MRITCISLMLSVIGLVFLLNPCQAPAAETLNTMPPLMSLAPTADGFLLTWDANPDQSLVYKVYWSNDESVDDVYYVGMFTTSNPEYEHIGLTPGQPYFYRIQACSCTCGALSDTVSAVFQPAPTEILKLSGTLTVNGVASVPNTGDQRARATIRAVEIHGANQGNGVLVNPDGTYQMALFPGNYDIFVDYWLGENWHGTWTSLNLSSFPAAHDMAVESDIVQNIDLSLHTMIGSVQDTNGTALAGVDLTYRYGGSTTSAEAGYEGAYKLYFLEGSYDLQARPPEGSHFGPAIVTVDVPGTAPTIVLPTLPLLSGMVTLNGAAIQPSADQSVSITVRATEINGANSGNTVHAESDGTYQMALLPGTYDISVDVWIWETWHGTGINFNAWGSPGPQNISFKTDAVQQNIDVTLYSLIGSVQDPYGTTIPDVRLESDQGSTTTSIEPGFEGAYKLYFLPGTYELAAEPPEGSRFGAAVVTVDVPGPAPVIVLHTEAMAMLSGLITLNGTAVEPGIDQTISATVRATEVNGADSQGRASVNPDGTYQMMLPPGIYNLIVDFWLRETWHGTQINLNAWGTPGAQNLTIETDTIQNIDILMHTLTGSVLAPDGTPIPNVALHYNRGTTTSSNEPGFEGAYKLYFLPGTYSLLVTAPVAVFPPFYVSGIEIARDTQRDIILGKNSTIEPPEPNESPIAVAGGPQVGTVGNAVIFDAGGSYDVDGEIVQYAWDYDGDGVFDDLVVYPNITHVWDAPYEGTVRLRVTDNAGFVAIDCVSISIVDAPPTPTPEPTPEPTPPDLTVSANPDILWPPNHKMIPVTISVVSEYFSLKDACRITSVTSNEPEDGRGDGHHAPDWEITGDLTLELRAERSGFDTDRVYTIAVACVDDASATTASASTEVRVPHDRKDKKCDLKKKDRRAKSRGCEKKYGLLPIGTTRQGQR